MARTIDAIVEEALGKMQLIVIRQQAEIERLRDENEALKKPAEPS